MDLKSQAVAQPVSWGSTEGQEVFLYTLRSAAGLELCVTNYGATVQSLRVPLRSGKVDVLLGYDSLEEYREDPYYMGCVVGRFANRIDGGVVDIDGHRYQLTVRPGGFHHHGGKQGFNKKVWETVSVEYGEQSSAITFRYVSPHLEEGYPGTLQVWVTYRVEGLTWHVDFRAVADRPTIINLTQHAYFNLKGHGSILDHVAKFDADEVLATNARIIPTGDFLAVRDTPFDFSKPVQVGARIDGDHPQLVSAAGYDHFYVLERTHTPVLKQAGVVYVPGGLRMDVLTTEPGFHFYTGNFIADGTPGKEYTRYGRRGGLCVETHHFPDSPNHNHFPTTVLNAGEEFSSQTQFRFFLG